ncbi:MAG: methyltransferase domain-containing protein [Nanoarchaeota archaeon]
MINVKEIKKEFLIHLLEKPINKILDLGCGNGFMSKFFHKKGAKAVGIDIQEISEDSENFKFVKGDIKKEDFGTENNLIIASLILHFLGKEDALKVINEMKEATSKEGYNLLVCMSDEDDLAKKKSEKFYPSFKELTETYNDWHLVKEVRGITEIEDHDDLGSHQHNLIFLLFQKGKTKKK